MTPENATNPELPKRVPDLIADTLVSQIKSGALSVGDALPTERELCEQFSTSRPTVREALSQLQLRGFVETGSGKRPRVTAPSIEDVLSAAAGNIGEILGNVESTAHLEQMRQFIEAGAARVATAHSSNVQVAKMRSALEANFAAIGTDNFAATDIAFHRSIVAVVGNPIILKLHDMFVSTMLAQRPDLSDRRSHDEMAYEEHRAIYEAVLSGDVVAATSLIDAHLERSYRSRLAAPKLLQPSSVHVGET